MSPAPGELKIGTCSWNYDSWLGTVNSARKRTAAEYLVEYCRSYRTVEVDSWFYKMPERGEAESYKRAVDEGFSFTCKAPQKITLVRERGASARNPTFLSPEVFEEFLGRLEPLWPQIDLVMLEFEYLNREKISGPAEFAQRIEGFLKAAPRPLPIGIECRNKNFLTGGYFSMLKENGATHVFSEKQYMPPAAEVAREFETYLGERVAFRLLGGDRKEIEEKTGERWDRIVDAKDPRPIVLVLRHLLNIGKRITLNINNHYEGSAPLTIRKIQDELAREGE